MPEIIVSLDGLDLGHALKLVQRTKEQVWGYLVNELIVEHGVVAVEKIGSYGKVLASIGGHGHIRNIMHNAQQVNRAGAAAILLHGSCGPSVVGAVASIVGDRAKLIVSAEIVNLDDEELKLVYNRNSPDSLGLAIVNFSHKNGAHGVLCSSGLLKYLPQLTLGEEPTQFLRLVAEPDSDFCALPSERVVNATHVIVGRRIQNAADPLAEVDQSRLAFNLHCLGRTA